MNPVADTSTEMKTFLLFFLALGLASSDKLDRTYLPPPGSKFAGGSPGAIQVPLEFPKESYSTITIPPASGGKQTTPGDTTPTIGIDRGVDVPIIRTGNLPSTLESKTPFTYFQSKVPTTTTSYAFTQTTTFPPIEGFETTSGTLGPVDSLFPTQSPLSNLQKQVGIVGFPQFPVQGQTYGQNLPGVQSSDLAQDKIRLESQHPSYIPTSRTELQRPGSVPGPRIPGKQSVFEQNRPDFQQIGEQRITIPTSESIYQRPSLISQIPGEQIYGQNIPGIQPSDRTQDKIRTESQRPSYIPTLETEVQHPVLLPGPIVSDKQDVFEQGRPEYQQIGKQGVTTPILGSNYQRPGLISSTSGGQGRSSYLQPDIKSQDKSIVGDQIQINAQRTELPSHIPSSQSVVENSSSGHFEKNVYPQDYSHYQPDQESTPSPTSGINSQRPDYLVPSPSLGGQTVTGLSSYAQPNVSPQVLSQQTKSQHPNVILSGESPIQRPGFVPQIPISGGQSVIDVNRPGSKQQSKDVDQFQRSDLKRPIQTPGILSQTQGIQNPLTQYQETQRGQDFSATTPPQDLSSNFKPGSTSMFGTKIPASSVFPGGDRQNIYGPGSTSVPSMFPVFTNTSIYANTMPGIFSTATSSTFAASYPTLSPFQQNIQSHKVRPERPQAESDRNAVILNYENVLTPEGFSYSFDTSNGIHADESGTATDGVKAQGSYSYVGDDGKIYSVIYSADENGFQPRGDHLPTPPPVPDEILRVIEQSAKDEEAGIFDDGSYDETKYGHKKYHDVMDSYKPTSEDGFIINGVDSPKSYENRFDDISKKPSDYRGSARRPTTTVDKSERYEGDASKGYAERKITEHGGRPSSRVPTKRPSDQISSQYAKNNLSSDRKIIGQNRYHLPIGSRTASGTKFNIPEVNDENVLQEGGVITDKINHSRKPSSRFPITRPSDKISNEEFKDNLSEVENIGHRISPDIKTESRIKSEDFNFSGEDLSRRRPTYSGITGRPSKYPKSDYETKMEAFETEEREEVHDKTLHPSTPSQLPDKRLRTKYPGDKDGLLKQTHEIGPSLNRSSSLRKPSRLPIEKQRVKYIKGKEDDINDGENYDVSDEEANKGTRPLLPTTIPSKKPETKVFADSYKGHDYVAGDEFNRNSLPLTYTRLPERMPGSKFEEKTSAIVDMSFNKAKEHEFGTGSPSKPNELPSRKPETKYVEVTDEAADYDNRPEQGSNIDERPLESKEFPSIRPETKYTVTKNNIPDKFIERQGISKMQHRISGVVKGLLRTTNVPKAYSESSSERSEISEEFVSKVGRPGYRDSYTEIPSIRTGFGQRLGKPTEIIQHVGLDRNKYLTQIPSEKEMGYQYVPPQKKFDDVENIFPSRIKPKQEEDFSTPTLSKSKPSFKKEKPIRPLMPLNVSREDEELYKNEEDQHFQVSHAKIPHRLNESDSQGETVFEYYQEEEIDHDSTTPSRIRPGQPGLRAESTRRPLYDNIEQSTTRPKYTSITQDFQKETLKPGQKDRLLSTQSSKLPSSSFGTSTPAMPSQTRFGSTQISDVSYPGIQQFSTQTYEGTFKLPIGYADGTIVSGFETSDKLRPDLGRISSARPGLDSQENIPSTTYRPNYTLLDKTLPSEGKPAVTIDEFGILIPSSQQPSLGSTTFSPGYTDVSSAQNKGFPSTGEGKNLHPGTGIIKTTDDIKEKPGEFGSTVGSFGKPGFSTVSEQTVTTPSYPKQPSTIGEDFSGPKQPQRYDPETGYHY